MSDSEALKIVYLFGAGATHAELTNLEKDPNNETFLKERGLLMSHVSERVIQEAQRNKHYLKDIDMVSAAKGSLNIELLISLIENSRIHNSASKTTTLKELVKKDIQKILTDSKLERFYLHKALLELHNIISEKEVLIGLISLNYDDVLDRAYKIVLGTQPNYYFSSSENKALPLLKLHGSFSWRGIKIRGKTRSVEIIPLGVSKYYLHVPYNLIWGRALELLIESDILRVIGCSLSPNDIHLIDLLFKAHLEKGKAFEIQIISSNMTGEEIKKNYGFFPEIKELTKIEEPLIPDQTQVKDIVNVFRTWLKYKVIKMLSQDRLDKTKYLKKVIAYT